MELLEKGVQLLPKVHKTRIEPLDPDTRGQSFGEGDSVQWDFGRHMAGHLHIELNYTGSHPDAPVLLKFHFAEMEQEFEEDASTYHGWICSSWIQQEQLHIDVLPAEVPLPRRYAFRYVRMEVLAVSSKFRITVENIFAEAETSADEGRLLPYHNSDASLVEIDRVACATLRDCMQRVFEDGPKRDARLWMGDLRLQALTNYVTYQNNDMVKACLYLFAGLPSEGGAVGGCLFLEPKPEADDVVMFDYSLLYVAALNDYYQQTRDSEALKDLWPTAKRQIGIALKHLDEDKVVKDSDVPGWCFLDWSLELNKQAGAQGVLLYALLNAIELAKAAKDTQAIGEFGEIYQACKEAALSCLYDEKSGLFVSGIEKQLSYASQIWMVLGKAVTGDEAGALLRRIATYKGAIRPVTPYLYHHYVQALIDIGLYEEALRTMKNYWGKMVEAGADTFWELYNPENPKESPYGGTIVNSFCHAWSCGPAYFLRTYFCA